MNSSKDIFITIKNTDSKVANFSKDVLRLLRKATEYFDMNMYVRTKKHFLCSKQLMDKNGAFPSGLLNRVVKCLEENNIKYHLIDERIRPSLGQHPYEMLIKEPPAYADQTECVEALMKSSQGIAEVPTGVGKTRIMKDCIQKMGLKTLVITPSSALRVQTYAYLKECFGTNNVGILGSTKTPKKISVMNYHSIANMDPSIFSYFDCLFYDEFHHSTNNTIREINSSHLKDIYYRYALTATNFTNDPSAQILMESVISHTAFSMSIPSAIKKKYIVPIIPVFIELENEDLASQNNYQKDYSKFIDNNAQRNLIISKLINTFKNKGVSCLCLVKHVKHGRDLNSLVDDSVFINGQDEDQNFNQDIVFKFNKLQIPIVIGTSVIGEGVDTKACGMVINAAAGKSKQQYMQRIGRACRNYPNKKIGLFFDFIDKNQKHLKSQSKFRMKIFKDYYGVEPTIVKASTILNEANHGSSGL